MVGFKRFIACRRPFNKARCCFEYPTMSFAIRSLSSQLVAGGSSLNVAKVAAVQSPTTVFIRGKRTKSKSALSPMVQRAVTQLSVMSASRKQPKLLKLTKEDLIKHQVVQRSWAVYNKDLRDRRSELLMLQYSSIKSAMTLLETLDPELFKFANESEADKKFPLEMKVPTDYPPNKVWQYNFRKTK